MPTTCHNYMIRCARRLQELRKKSLELVVYLALADIGGNIGDTLGYNHHGALCTFQAMLFQVALSQLVS